MTKLATVCYGMVSQLRLVRWMLPLIPPKLESLPIAAIPTASVFDSPTLVHGLISGDGTIQRASDEALIGKLDEKATQCLSKLANEGVHIQFMLNRADASGKSRTQRTRTIAVGCAILYGPEDFADDIGHFLDRCGYCLQDPYGCELNVPYKNPHCLSTLFEEPLLTSNFLEPENNRESAFSVSNSLREFQTNENLPEWQQPDAIITELCT